MAKTKTTSARRTTTTRARATIQHPYANNNKEKKRVMSTRVAGRGRGGGGGGAAAGGEGNSNNGRGFSRSFVTSFQNCLGSMFDWSKPGHDFFQFLNREHNNNTIRNAEDMNEDELIGRVVLGALGYGMSGVEVDLFSGIMTLASVAEKKANLLRLCRFFCKRNAHNSYLPLPAKFCVSFEQLEACLTNCNFERQMTQQIIDKWFLNLERTWGIPSAQLEQEQEQQQAPAPEQAEAEAQAAAAEQEQQLQAAAAAQEQQQAEQEPEEQTSEQQAEQEQDDDDDIVIIGEEHEIIIID